MNKYCIWKHFSDKEYGAEPFIFSYKRKTRDRIDYRYCSAKLLKIPSQDLIKNNRIKINKKGYCYLNVKPVNVEAKPKFERFWSWYIKKIVEFEAESDEEALLKYELGEY